MTKMKALALIPAALLLSSFSFEALANTCRIDWHPRGGGLLAVFVGDRVYKNKAYIAHDDVLRLRDVLISSGECQRDLAQESCSVRQTQAGKFQIHFGARPLYKREIHKTSSRADKRMRDLVKVGFCSTDKPSQPRQVTASSKIRKLKISQ